MLFVLHYRTHYCDDSVTIATISEVLYQFKTAHKILIAAQKNLNLLVFLKKSEVTSAEYKKKN